MKRKPSAPNLETLQIRLPAKTIRSLEKMGRGVGLKRTSYIRRVLMSHVEEAKP